MSMNLILHTKRGHYVDFPFQTPTSLTYAVLQASGTEERLKLIEECLDSWKWTKDEKEEMLQRCSSLLQDPDLILDMI